MVATMRGPYAYATLLVLLVALPSGFVVALGDGRLSSIKSFAVYYGSDEIDKLALFDLVILSPAIPKDIVEELNNRGVITIGYISISSIGGWEPWAKLVGRDIIVAENPAWGEKIINVCSSRWVNIVVYNIVPYVLGRGFRGVFLDNLDIVDSYTFMRECVIEVIKLIRTKYPGSVIIVNRGFSIAIHTAS